jgi:hypothetical protein
MSRLQTIFVFISALILYNHSNIQAQANALKEGSKLYFDSLDNRISYLEQQIPRLKLARDVSYYNFQRELDLTIFLKTYKEYLLDEDLDVAKRLVETRLQRAEFRKDQYSVEYYNKYKDDINNRIKQQRIHYQELFAKEKTFRKEFEALIKPGTIESYQKAERMVKLAINYANENNLTGIVKNLERYLAYNEALIFDANSSYDLAEITNNAKSFEKIFLPLVESDSLKQIKEAEALVAYCSNYADLSGSQLTSEYFSRQGMVVTSALSDLLDKEGKEKDLVKLTSQAVKARFDTLNPCGVYKWHDQVIVIDEFIPNSTMDNVQKGQAIIHADKILANYLKKNKLCESVDNLKFGHTFIIPYKSNQKNSSFLFNPNTQKWQYIVCYTSIVSASYTQQVSKYMPPVIFADEKATGDIQEK